LLAAQSVCVPRPAVCCDSGCAVRGCLRPPALASLFFSDPAPTYISNLSLHDALPISLNSNNEHEVSEFYIENGSYIKLKSLTLGYTLPKAVLDKMKMRHARIYFQAQNLFTITGYTGADPEGLGYPYPLPRTFSL